MRSAATRSRAGAGWWPVLAALLAFATAGCDDVLLDGPTRTVPGKRCEDGLELDPDVGGCVPERCTGDDRCEADRRCDLVLGQCVPCEAGGCFQT